MASGFILELGDFKTFGKTDPFCRDKTLRGNRPGGKVMMEIFYFFPNNYLEQLNMVPKCRLRSTSTTQIDKNDKKRTFKNPQGCLESLPEEDCTLIVSGKY